MSNQPTRQESKPQFELKCHVDSSMLSLLREFVCCVSRHLGFCDEQISEIEISVDEACANAIEHAYSREFENGQDLTVEITYSDDELTIRVSDHGKGSHAGLDRRIQQLEEYLDSERDKYRGLGFLLMQKFMDKVNVHSQPGYGTTVEMTKIRK